MLPKLLLYVSFCVVVRGQHSYSDFLPIIKINYDGLDKDCLEAINKTSEDPMALLRMFDATSKPPAGILEGHVLDYGNFDECVAIESNGIKGKYCPFSLVLPVLGPQVLLSTCIPDKCQINTMFKNNSIVATGAQLPCQTNDAYKDWDAADYACLGVLAFVLFLMVLCTLFDYILLRMDMKSPHPLLVSFSVITNGKKLLAVSHNPEQVHCLNGLRCVSMMWVIAGHRFATNEIFPMINTLDAYKWKADTKSAYIQGAPVSVDTFFFMSAFLFSYTYFKNVKRAFTWRNVPSLYLHRFLRITPAVGMLYFVQVTIFRRLTSGPLWPLMIEQGREVCLKWWWSFFLYVQNYTNYETMCIIPTWYLSADMQMFIVAPFVILLLGYLVDNKKRKSMAYWVGAQIAMYCMMVTMFVDFGRVNKNDYDTHSRLSTYVIGIVMGMAIVDLKNKKKKITGWTNILIWTIMLAVMATIVVFMHDIRNFPTVLKTNIFFSLSRPAWSLGLCWIVYSCTMGTGGVINWFLSRPIFQILGKLTYSMYLLHSPVIGVSLGRVRNAVHFSDYDAIYYWCGDFIFTLLLAIVWVLAFEFPVATIETVIFGGTKKKKKEETVVVVRENLKKQDSVA